MSSTSTSSLATTSTTTSTDVPSTVSPSPSTTSASSSPSSSASNTSRPQFGGAGSELYLFTFLTTLLLLLAVSCAIIIRSLVLRRRFRRRVQEAIANGVFIPGLMDRTPREIGERPKMWDVLVAAPEDRVPTPTGKQWENVYPVSVTKLPSAHSAPSLATHAAPFDIPNQRRGFISRIWGRPRTPLGQTASALEAQSQLQTRSPSQQGEGLAQEGVPLSTRLPAQSQMTGVGNSKSEGSGTGSGEKQASEVQLSLLIAMPSALRPTHGKFAHPHSNPNSNSNANANGNGNASHPIRLSTNTNTDSEHDPKGKLPDTTATVPFAWEHLEEGEVPHLEMGVLEVKWRDDGSVGTGEGVGKTE